MKTQHIPPDISLTQAPQCAPFIACLMLALTPAAWAVTETFTATGAPIDWTAPTGVTSITVECRGGGGAAGSVKSTGTGNRACSGGGAGGSYARKVVGVTPGTLYKVVVGAGGVPVTAVTVNNTALPQQTGGASKFTDASSTVPEIVLATGGAGGNNALKSTSSVNAAGGVGSSVGCIGDVVFAGGNGGTPSGTSTTRGAGAGGGGAGDANPGGNAGTVSAFGPGGGAGGGKGGVGRGATGGGSTVGPEAPGGATGGVVADTAAEYFSNPGARGEVKLTYVFETGIDHFAVAAASSQTAGVAFDVTITAQGPAPTNATVNDSVTPVTMTSPGGSLMEFDWNSDGTYGDNSGTLVAGVKTIKARNKKAEEKTIVATSDTDTTPAPASVTTSAAAFAKLQILAPGETTAPATASGKTGTPGTQFSGIPFNVTVNAVDEFWNLASSVADTVGITSTDSLAALPANAALGGSTGTFPVTLNTIGSFTLTATDITDGAKSSDTTPAITVQDPTLVWKGGASNLWNTTALNWLNPLSTPVAFTPGAIALFNDTPAPLGVDIVGTVTPVSTSVDSTNNYTLGSTSGGLIGGTGGLTKAGTGTLTLTTANTYGGDTAINAGKLNAGNNSAFGSTGTVTLGNTGATLELANSIVIDRPLTLSNTGDKKTLSLVAGATTGAYSGAITNSETTAGNFELSVGTPGALTLSGAVAGNTLTKTGDGTLILSGAADNVGLILNATAGEVQLGKTSGSGVRAVSGISGISSGATVKLTGTGGDQILGGGTAGQGINGLAAGGTLNLNGNSESVSFLFGAGYSGGVVDGGSGTVTFTVGESNVASWFPGEIKNSSGTLSLVKVGTNTVTLIGANTYSGTTEIRNGALLLTYGDDRLPVTTAVILGSGPDSATLRLGSSNTVSDPKPGTACNQTITSLTTSGTGTANAVIGGKASVISTLTLNNSDAVVYGGRLGGAGTHDNELALTKTGAGTFTFSGTATYKGNTTVSAGTLELAETGQLRFVLGASSGSNNSLAGAGTATINGDFVIDTTAADALPSGTWTLEDVSTLTDGAYGSNFSVIGFTDAGSDKWTKPNGTKTYIFDETTGILTLVSDPFTAWAGAGVNFDDDANNDGVDNGLAWFLGATDEDASATGLLPKSTQNAGALVLEFYCLAGTARGTAVFEVQYSNDLGQSDVWAGTVVPATVGTFTDGIVDFEITDPEPAGGLLKVVATIPLTEAAAGKLFGRIVGVK